MNLFSKISLVIIFAVSFATSALGEDAPRFDINRYQVDGNSIIPAAEIDNILAPFTGKNSDFGTLQQAVEMLEQTYRSRGYHAVKVLLPEQELKGGVVKLTVFEVRVGTVAIEGNKHFDNANIRASIPELKEGSVPDLDKISMNIRVANENPARKTQMVLQGGERADTTNAVLKVADEKPWKVGTSLDDTGNDSTGTLRLGFLAQHANLFNLDHLLTLQYITSPSQLEKVKIYSFGYRIPFYKLGDSVDLYGGYSDVDSGTVQTGTVQTGILNLNVSGKGTFAGVRYNQNLIRKGSYEHRILYGIDYRNVESNYDYAGTQLGTTTAALPISVGYTGSYSIPTGSDANFWISLSQNIPGTNNGETVDYYKQKANAPADFFITRVGGTVRAALPGDWQAKWSVNGQYTAVPLISSEQFGVGGQSSLRGFEERYFTSDVGVASTVEFYTPEIMKLVGAPKSQLRALAFYDSAFLGRNSQQSGEGRHFTAGSVGVGLRFSIANNFVASTDYGIVTDTGESSDTARSRSLGDARWHFKIQMSY